MFGATQMKRNEYLVHLHNDIVKVFAHLFMKGNKKKAQKILDQHQEATIWELTEISGFSGGSLALILLIIIYTLIYTERHEKPNQEFYWDEMFELGPFLRLLFSVVFLTYAGAILVNFWQKREINYIHLLQIDYKNRLNSYEILRIASLLGFFFLLIVYLAIQELETIYHDYAKDYIATDD